ncbi:hypothetical protein HanHA300_Chr15g0587361 [Helianthus annuus]|nr:hypothetical protein HanHA300_Chr15g0587361 [Helianthus annuus]KAJ0475094.1 hypothetical protein HanHA89_Chr15g0637181 [Helianthus annuus]KAJ0650649.1 hypothetical protein HanLR1_Chr15g0598091 [Helianthus annuus]
MLLLLLLQSHHRSKLFCLLRHAAPTILQTTVALHRSTTIGCRESVVPPQLLAIVKIPRPHIAVFSPPTHTNASALNRRPGLRD